MVKRSHLYINGVKTTGGFAYELRAVVAFKVAVVEPVEALPLVSVVAVMARDGGDVSVQLVVVKVCCNVTKQQTQPVAS